MYSAERHHSLPVAVKEPYGGRHGSVGWKRSCVPHLPAGDKPLPVEREGNKNRTQESAVEPAFKTLTPRSQLWQTELLLIVWFPF